jgi:hypothetical protein
MYIFIFKEISRSFTEIHKKYKESEHNRNSIEVFGPSNDHYRSYLDVVDDRRQSSCACLSELLPHSLSFCH